MVGVWENNGIGNKLVNANKIAVTTALNIPKKPFVFAIFDLKDDTSLLCSDNTYTNL
jgi:hypothetical protein